MSLARKRIRQYLSTDPDIETIGECKNGSEAIKTISRLKPDLVFLDIQMPNLGGFEVVEAIGPKLMPAVVFVTAYDEFALRAFDINALDYLLKPFDEERLKRSIERAKASIKCALISDLDTRLQKLLKEINTAPKYPKRLPVKSAQRTIFLPTEEINWIGAAGNYMELHMEHETHLIRERMSSLEEKLDPHKFVRVHRSTIVNIDRIKELYPLFNEDHLIILRDGTRLTLSRTYYHQVKSVMQRF
jgi:two-component system LytT family response regulator